MTNDKWVSSSFLIKTIIKDKMKRNFRTIVYYFQGYYSWLKLYKTFVDKTLTNVNGNKIYIHPPPPKKKLILIQIPMKHFSFGCCNKYRNKCQHKNSETRKKKLIKNYNSTQRL